MTQYTPAELRELILDICSQIRPSRPEDGNLQLNTLFSTLRDRLGRRLSHETEEEVLTQFHDLIRTGYFAWGFNLDNPNPPFFHFTDRGLKSVERLKRDPGNPSGYLKHLEGITTLNAIASSYLREALACFEAGLYKAAAVMVGAAAESLILELRDTTRSKLAALALPEPKNLGDWRIKTILDALRVLLDGKAATMPKPLREKYEAYFQAFALQIRASRNEAGHPSSVDPVTEEGVHASFLIFPELANLSDQLRDWISSSMR